MADGSDDVFDVASDRRTRTIKREKIWTKKRKDIDKEIRDALQDAQAETDPCESNVKFTQLESLIKRRKLATSVADATKIHEAAVKKFGIAPNSQYNILLVDPPYEYKRTAHKCGTGRQYKTMTLEELSALPISGVAAEDAVLIVWTTYHMIDTVSRLYTSWGFEVTTVFCDWIKVDRACNPLYGQSSYTKPCSEFALLGVRGSMHVKSSESVVNSVLFSRPRGHSRKPHVVRDMIVKLFGDFPRIEFFSRHCPPDWDGWGNQTEHFTNEWSREESTKTVDNAFFPRIIDRKRQRNDRIYKTDALGSVDRFASTTMSTSFTRLDNEFTVGPTAFDANSQNDDHDHDGSLPCCAPASVIVPHNQLRNVVRLDAFLYDDVRSYDAVRNTLYTLNSEKTVRDNSKAIKQKQRYNSDILHAILHNPGRNKVRVSDPNAETTTNRQKK